jgi:hypothetical protein
MVSSAGLALTIAPPALLHPNHRRSDRAVRGFPLQLLRHPEGQILHSHAGGRGTTFFPSGCEVSPNRIQLSNSMAA